MDIRFRKEAAYNISGKPTTIVCEIKKPGFMGQMGPNFTM